MLSWPSTLGFGPSVESTAEWTSEEGRRRFLEMVRTELRARLEPDSVMPDLYRSKELDRILDNAITLDRTATLDEPGDEILQAVRSAATMYLGRIRMYDRNAAIRSMSLDKLNDPRARSGAERRASLEGKTVVNTPGTYDKFLASQRELRTRYA